MKRNIEETTGYFTMSKTHANMSFAFAVVSSLLGFAFFMYSIISGLSNSSIDAVIISAIAGGLTELLTIFILHIHKNALVQLNKYYEALHESEKYLSAITLVAKLDKVSQIDAYARIIDRTLNSWQSK